MLRHKSAQKRARQTIKKTERNRKYKALIKGSLKRALTDTDKASTEEQVKKTTQILDRAATKGVIHKNKASRLKSRIARHLNKVSA